MPLDKGLAWTRLSEIWVDDSVRVLETRMQKYALMSDTHLGDGGAADDFHRNEQALLNALEYYLEKDYKLILLGDFEELWQFDLKNIVDRYNHSIYAAIRAFGDERIFRVFGNHDLEWGGLVDPTKQNGKVAGVADEAIKLKDPRGNVQILLVHGHQGSIDSEKFAWFSRFFVRMFKGIEPVAAALGLYGHTSATKSQVPKDYERILYSWAKANKVLFVCGHSHRAIFASRSYADQIQDDIADLVAENARRGIHKITRIKNLRKIKELESKLNDEKDKGRLIEIIDPGQDPLPNYFNTGCGLYTDGITTIEFDHDTIRLVKWSKDDVSGPLREVYNSGSISKFLDQIGG